MFSRSGDASELGTRVTFPKTYLWWGKDVVSNVGNTRWFTIPENSCHRQGLGEPKNPCKPLPMLALCTLPCIVDEAWYAGAVPHAPCPIVIAAQSRDRAPSVGLRQLSGGDGFG